MEKHGASQTDRADLKESAKNVLERVCSGAGLDPASHYYSPVFIDYVNDMTFRGLAGTEQSIKLYTEIFSDIRITVKEQVVQSDRVASRFVFTGTNLKRRVCFNGIVISRFENGLIVEDWSVTDSLGMLRQLGLWRSILVGLRQWKTLRTVTRNHLSV